MNGFEMMLASYGSKKDDKKKGGKLDAFNKIVDFVNNLNLEEIKAKVEPYLKMITGKATELEERFNKIEMDVDTIKQRQEYIIELMENLINGNTIRTDTESGCGANGSNNSADRNESGS